MYEDGSGIIVFGMTPNEFFQVASQMRWSCTPKSAPNEFGSVECGKLHFGFMQNTLGAFYVSNKSFQTDRGLQVGDSVKKMKQLYGSDFGYDNADDMDMYWYTLPNEFELNITANENSGIIVEWGMALP